MRRSLRDERCGVKISVMIAIVNVRFRRPLWFHTTSLSRNTISDDRGRTAFGTTMGYLNSGYELGKNFELGAITDQYHSS
jgi:hypothetical protein